MSERHFEYDVGLSFAGEQRWYVRQVADDLKSREIRIFFDENERVSLWGKDLNDHLTEIFQHKCRYCVVFVSKEYVDKMWTNAERRSALARALKEKQEYILPARFDDTVIPGLLYTVHYIDLRETPPSELSDIIARKLGKGDRRNYLPPKLDRLFEWLDIEDDQEAQDHVSARAFSFFQALGRMTPDETNAVINLLKSGCSTEFPDNFHIKADLLSRLTGQPVTRLKQLLGGIKALGFECSFSESAEDETRLVGVALGDAYVFRLNWFDLSVREESPALEEDLPSLLVASEMIELATENYCPCCQEHGMEILERLDFSQLGSVLASKASNESKE